MILNKSLLLYINHFDSINKNISNKDCFHLNRETNLQHAGITKQNNGTTDSCNDLLFDTVSGV